MIVTLHLNNNNKNRKLKLRGLRSVFNTHLSGNTERSKSTLRIPVDDGVHLVLDLRLVGS